MVHSTLVEGYPTASSSDANADTGISQLVARILGQLSLSSWLPAGLLTIVGTFVVQFALQGNIDLGSALTSLSQDKWLLVILVVPALVLATLITQAFAFESIRILEGYWRPAPFVFWLQGGMIRRKSRRKNRLNQQRLALSHAAFTASRPRWLKAGFSAEMVNALESASIEGDLEEALGKLSEEDAKRFPHFHWQTRCDPALMAKINHLSRAVEDFPADHRILPTKLGNVMRATEDRLKCAVDDVEGFALRRREHASARVQLQHDQFRTRLDMYCTLVFVAALLAALSVILLSWGLMRNPARSVWDVAGAGAIVLGLLCLAAASYQAAISSARGYLTALKHMDEVESEE